MTEEIFSDAVNESFGYVELVYEGNTFLVDTRSKDSLNKFLTITGGSFEPFRSLDFRTLNSAIQTFDVETLERYGYARTEAKATTSRDAYWVLYSKAHYKRCFSGGLGNVSLHLRDGVEHPGQPLGLRNFESLFANNTFRRLNLNHWDLSGITSANGMFVSCKSAEEILIDKWDVSNFTDLGGVFTGCESLKSLDLSMWKPENAEYLDDLFLDCTALIDLNLTGWDQFVHKAKLKKGILENCPAQSKYPDFK